MIQSGAIGAILFTLSLGCPASAQIPTPSSTFIVTPVAERLVEALPPGPLYWRIERFDGVDGGADAGPQALLVKDGATTWSFTLAARNSGTSGQAPVAEIGPVPVPLARRYLLRVNRAGGPPGAATPVHSHPGSESFYVISGRLCQRTDKGQMDLAAGRSAGGHPPGMTMQLTSCGTAPLDQFVLFLVDAEKPFSKPAQFK